MKVIVVTTTKGNTKSVCEFPTKKSAIEEIERVWGFKPSKGIKNTYYGCVTGVVGYLNATARIFTAKEWETVQYAY